MKQVISYKLIPSYAFLSLWYSAQKGTALSPKFILLLPRLLCSNFSDFKNINAKFLKANRPSYFN